MLMHSRKDWKCGEGEEKVFRICGRELVIKGEDKVLKGSLGGGF